MNDSSSKKSDGNNNDKTNSITQSLTSLQKSLVRLRARLDPQSAAAVVAPGAFDIVATFAAHDVGTWLRGVVKVDFRGGGEEVGGVHCAGPFAAVDAVYSRILAGGVVQGWE